MGDLRTVITLITALAGLVHFAVAANITVGGPSGAWDLSTNLQAWASSQKFEVGDNLIFQYTGVHTVLEVKKSDYDLCRGTNPLQVYNDGSTVVAVSAPGKRYFICGTSGHCSQGMKLQVDISAAAVPPTTTPRTPSPTSSKAPTPSPSKGAAPSPSPAEDTTTSSPTSSAFPPSESSPGGRRGTAPVPSTSAADGGCSPLKLALGFGFGLVMLLDY